MDEGTMTAIIVLEKLIVRAKEDKAIINMLMHRSASRKEYDRVIDRSDIVQYEAEKGYHIEMDVLEVSL
jgi:hypothetical protein